MFHIMAAALRIPKTIAPDGVTKIVEELTVQAEPLWVTEKIVANDPLAIPQTLLALVSWRARFTDIRVYTDFADTDAAARSLNRNVVLLTAVLCANSVLTEKGEDVTAAARRAALRALGTAPNIPTQASGVEVGAERAVLAADHVYGFEAPSGLYHYPAEGAEPTLHDDAHELYAREGVDPDQRDQWPLGWRVLGMSPVFETRKQNEVLGFAKRAADLGDALFELMQNTDDHARTDASGYPLKVSVRGVHVRALNGTREALTGSTSHRDLAEYFSDLPDENYRAGDPSSRLRLVAVTVFDSGPGIAAKNLYAQGYRGDITPKIELPAMLNTLRRSDAGHAGGMRGLGLSRVQRYLTAVGGYAMVRSGRYRLTRDFLRFPFAGDKDEQQHWFGGVQAPTALPRVRGTAITMVIPVTGGRDA